MSPQKSLRQNLWQTHAKQWSRIASPLRPNDEDVRTIRQALEPGGGNYLILGVTPEFAGLPGRMAAIDHSAAMIEAVWPGNLYGRSAVQGNWLQLPFGAGVFDAIIGDGCLTLLSYPQQYIGLFDQLRRVLGSRGKVLLRAFASPDESESSTMVCREALDGRIGSFHAFKWRLAMAMVKEAESPNISVDDIHQAFCHRFPDRKILAAATGWNMEDIGTVDAYHASPTSYSFPTLTQLRQSLPEDFRETRLAYGSYELAARCPILLLEIAQ